jgi:hypothetical protein
MPQVQGASQHSRLRKQVIGFRVQQILCCLSNNTSVKSQAKQEGHGLCCAKRGREEVSPLWLPHALKNRSWRQILWMFEVPVL